jgi:hypothetical protein
MAIMSESSIRKFAARRGYSIKKSRRGLSIDNYGKFMLSDRDNWVVIGARFDADIEQISGWMKENNPPILPRWR